MSTIIKLLSYSLLTSAIAIAILLVMKFYYITDKRYIKRLQLADVFAMGTLILLASLRYGVGSDYFNYLNQAIAYGINFSSASSLFQGNIMRDYSYQIGYAALSVFSYKTFHNEYAIFCVVACIIYIPYILYFRRKSPNVFYSLCVYVLFGLWGLSLNIIKQAIAMVFICFAYEALKKKRFVLFAFLTVGGVLFHSTALLAAIGLVAATFIKPTFRNLNICIGIGVILKFVIMFVIRFLTRFTIFARYYSRYIYGDSVSGMNRTVIPVGVLLETIFVIYILYLAIGNRSKLKKFIPDIDSYISVVMLSIPFSVLGLSGTLWLANRFAKFFLQFLTILLPSIMMQGKDLFREKRFVIKPDSSFILLVLLFVWHFFYSSLMLDNNTFVIRSLL